MIYVTTFQAQLIQAGLFVAGIALLGFGYYKFSRKKPKVRPVKKSIYDRPVKPMSLVDRLKASWAIGWQSGLAYGEKKRQERKR